MANDDDAAGWKEAEMLQIEFWRKKTGKLKIQLLTESVYLFKLKLLL